MYFLVSFFKCFFVIFAKVQFFLFLFVPEDINNKMIEKQNLQI